MHSLWFFFLQKREFSWLLIIVLIAVGLYALIAIPKESSPEVVVPVGIVTTLYPGASAADVEELVTIQLEDAIENIDGLDSLTSASRDGVSSITAEFAASADLDKSLQELRDAVDSATPKLPSDAEDPFVSEVNFANQPIVVVSISSDASPTEFTALSERLIDELQSVSGVSEVLVSGTREREVQVIVEPARLAAFGFDLSAVTNALATGNQSAPVGTITTGAVEYSVRVDSPLTTTAHIGALPIGTRGGTPIYIRDVSEVAETVDTSTSLSRVSVANAPSETAMTLSIYKKSGVNVTAMSEAVQAELTQLQAPGGLLATSQVFVVYDQGELTAKDLSQLVKAGFETIFLVMVSLLLTIGWRESVVAGLSIPLSFVIAFIGLYASGNTINFISLFALILAVGILVDSGIVVTEAIHTRLQRNGDALKAARETIIEYAWPLIAGTMTTVAVFAPLFFLSGVTGEFIASIPFTIIFVLLASIFVALGMVPLIAIALTANTKPNRFEKVQEHYTKIAQEWYRRHLVRFLNNKKGQRIFLYGLFVCFILSLSLPATGALKVIFFPPEDVDYIYIDVETAQGTPLARTDLAVRLVEEILYDTESIVAFTSGVGSASAFTGGTGTGGRFGSITVELEAERDKTSAEISAELRERFAAIKTADIKITEQQNGPPTGAPVVIKFIGDDLTVLSRTAETASLVLDEIPGTRDIESSADSSASEFIFTVDRAKAAILGVSPAAITGALRASVFGITATTLRRNGEDTDVVVKLGNAEDFLNLQAEREVTLDTLRTTSVVNQQGELILIGSVIEESIAPASGSITREDGERVVTVSAYTEGETTATEIISAFKAREAELATNTNTRISYGGETEDINKSFTEMFLALVAGLLLMLGILVLSFNSVRYSLYLLLAVPYSLIGVFVGLTVTGLALSFTSLLGVIALAGVIINHAIILLDSLINHKAAEHTGGTLLDQVADASVTRFRPIMLTTVTTVVGMIPLSTISDFWSPLAFAIMFGLLFAMVLTLVLVPTLFYRSELKKQSK
jgi:multidrug efflux pump